jgi:hypothetical protein
MVTPRTRSLSVLLGAAVFPCVLAAQAAVDPSVAPRAAAMARAGARAGATELLGHYLATAPDDGAAWTQLGLFYLLDSRDWHRQGHQGDPPGPLFLDFAATALDQALRVPTDSALLLRAMVELDRTANRVEQNGWAATLADAPLAPGVAPPAYVAEIGRNLVNSCPVGGVLVAGSDLEAVGVWSVVVNGRHRADLVLMLPRLYGEDSLYRMRMADALRIDAVLPVSEALTRTAHDRPVCLSPETDSSASPHVALVPARMIRLGGPAASQPTDPLSVIELAEIWHSRPRGLAADAAEVYLRAARFNQVLCASLLAPLGLRGRGACGQ